MGVAPNAGFNDGIDCAKARSGREEKLPTEHELLELELCLSTLDTAMARLATKLTSYLTPPTKMHQGESSPEYEGSYIIHQITKMKDTTKQLAQYIQSINDRVM